MRREEWIRAGALYFPLMFALLTGLLRQRRAKQFAACLLGLVWAAPSLLIVQRLNLLAGWWQFSSVGFAIRGMPLELYLGWTVLWGVLPQLVFRRLQLTACVVVFVIADLILMPSCRQVVQLGTRWLAGESVAILVVLIPALCLGRWTLDDSHLRPRAMMQVMIAGMLFLYLVPEIAFALRASRGWAPLLALSAWQRELALQGLVLLAIPGTSAVMEFAERGMGTPIPYDSPKRLVRSGIYRYCANPMQASCAAVMFGWAILLCNVWLLLAAVISGIYSAGIAEWDERQDLIQRFGTEWKIYRLNVKNWRVRWRPYTSTDRAHLHIAASCLPCSELRGWIERRKPLGLDLIAAEALHGGSIHRLRYDPGDGSPAVEGIRALGRALEHLHLGWALAGMTMRLPVVWRCIQLAMDASGLGPRPLPNMPAAK
jgi:protein-S-isoprenylcysteine O-methyltransferase Ste14